MDNASKMSKPHYNVLIAAPAKNFEPAFVESLVKTCAWLNEQGLTYKFLTKSSSLIMSGRELTALDLHHNDWETREVGAGQFTYDKIFWIDSDIEWDIEQFQKIWESDLDIVGGLYQSHPNGTVACSFFDEDGLPKKVREPDFFMLYEPIEVYGLGFGFIAMKQGVFEGSDRPWFKIEHLRWPMLEFDTNVGEDYSFCINARRNGFKTYVDPTVRVKHHKSIVYELPPA
jgi:hypothetical protein